MNYPPPHPFEHNEGLKELRALAKMFGLNYLIGAHTTWPTPDTWVHHFFAADMSKNQATAVQFETFSELADYVKALASEKSLGR